MAAAADGLRNLDGAGKHLSRDGRARLRRATALERRPASQRLIPPARNAWFDHRGGTLFCPPATPATGDISTDNEPAGGKTERWAAELCWLVSR